MITLVGYIARCNYHHYLIVTPFKSYDVTTDKNQFGKIEVSVKDEDAYSQAVYCHDNGIPAIIRGENNDTDPFHEKNPRYLRNATIEPIEDCEDTFKETVKSLTLCINSAEDTVSEMKAQTQEIVKGFLTAFTLYQDFKDSYVSAASSIDSAQFHAKMLTEMLPDEEHAIET